MSSALDALSLRQRVVADNIANVQTPGYQAKRVEFEDALTTAVKHGSGLVTASTKVSLEPTTEAGNNVNLDTEVLSNIDTNLRYTLATRAVDNQFSLLRSALKST